MQNDWLIVGCLTSSGKYFMHFQDNKFGNYQKLQKEEEGMENSDFLFFKSFTALSVAFSKYITN